MKKVLLVDDESYMLDLLKQLIPWEFYGFSIVGAAENATEAMKIFHRESPDVIITDICMENISGIEFITRIRMQDTAVKVIIISAYDKFEYAQRALKLNVNGYLLKPINREELLNTLIEVQKELDSREGYQDRIQYLQESLAQLKRKYLEEQLLRLYRNETDFLPEEITGEGFWCVVSLQTIVRSEIVFIEQDIRSVQGLESYILFVGDGLFAVFLCSGDEGKLEECLDRIRNKYCKEEKTVLCGASGRAKNELTVLCQDSKKALHGLFYQEGIFFSDRGEAFREQCAKQAEPISREQFMLWIVAGEPQKCRDYFAHWMDECRKRKAERETVIREVRHCLEWMKEIARQDMAEKFELLEQKISNILRFSEAVQIWEEGLQLLESHGMQQGRAGIVISRAQEYVKGHCCQEEFSIEQLAEFLHLSKSYLSKIYKNETGESIWNFVMRVRITRAKELLVGTDYTNYAIARAIGYSSEYHFSRAFSKMVGVSPSAYKKMYMRLEG